MTWDEDLDCQGLLCPLPVLRARKRLIGMAPGMVLRITA
ncbi:MAG: sulfurtransferase TusA family protein, partial [Rhodobacter sp.]